MKPLVVTDEKLLHGQRGPADHERRQQILQAADKHFRHYGYRKTTVGDLAKQIGLSSAYIYKFFNSKQAIGSAVCAFCLDRVIGDLERAVVQSNSPSSAIRNIFQELASNGLRLLNEEKKMHDLVAVTYEERWPCLESFNSSFFGLIRKVVMNGRELSEFERKTPLDETCRAICRTTQYFFHPILLEQNHDHLHEEALEVANMLIRSLVV